MTITYGIIIVGPVQSLIAQARRTQDLWVGSQLLQQLIRAGIETAQKEGADIIAPDVNVLAQGGSVPNRFIFRCADSATARTIIDSTHKAIIEAWETYAERTRLYFTMPLRDGGLGMEINEDIWQRQIDPQYWLEFYAATHSAENDAHLGKEVFKLLMQNIAAQKLVRAMPQHPNGEPGYKCSVTGEHEALHDQESGEIALSALRAYWNTVREKQRNSALLSKDERLSAFSIVKRFGHEANPDLHIERFPSTSSIASANIRRRLIEHWQAIRSEVETYLTTLENLYRRHQANAYFMRPEVLPGYRNVLPDNWERDDVLLRFLKLDGDFLYLDHLQPRPLAEHMGTVQHRDLDRRLMDNARVALKTLYDVAAQHKISEPSNYYAVLAMDGDRMGEVAESFETAEEYTDFSGGLTQFARDIIFPAVEKNAVGRVVYAGGDDLLALLPLSDVFAAAEAIRKAFPGAAKHKTTMSAGIAIVHRMHSLQAAVRAAKRAEHIAKEKYRTAEGAFAFEVLRRSGEPQSGGSTWVRVGTSVMNTVIALRDAMSAKDIAHGLASDLPELLYRVVNTNDPEKARQLEQVTIRHTVVEIPSELRQLTFKRLFERRCSDQYKKLDDGKPARILREHMEKIGESRANGHGWFDIQALLYLARFLSQEGGA